MIGPAIALISAIAFAFDAIFSRRAVLNTSNASLGTLITVPMSIPPLLLILAINGQLPSIKSFSCRSYFWLSLAGMLYFVAGRSFYYKCVQLVGANITLVLRRVNILIAVILGIFVLDEPFSWQLAMGVLAIITGITLVSFIPVQKQGTSLGFTKIPVKGFFFGGGCGIFYGLAPICVRLGLKNNGSPVAGALISFAAATAVLDVSLLTAKRRTALKTFTAAAVIQFTLAGALSFSGNLLRYVALSLAPAGVVAALVSTTPVFLLLFSYLINRNLDIFTEPIILGTLMVVIGSALLV